MSAGGLNSCPLDFTAFVLTLGAISLLSLAYFKSSIKHRVYKFSEIDTMEH